MIARTGRKAQAWGSLLPAEIVCDCFRRLGARDVMACKHTCRRFKHLVEHSSELKLIIELMVSHRQILDESAVSMSWVDQLSELERVERQWARLDCGRRSEFLVSGANLPICVPGANTVAVMEDLPEEGAREGASSPSTFHIFTLPPSHEPSSSILEKELSYPMGEVGFVLAFTVDPLQDLLELVVYMGNDRPYEVDGSGGTEDFELWFMSIEQGAPHPSAARPALSLVALELDLTLWENVGASNEELGMHVRGPLGLMYVRRSYGVCDGNLHVYNWHSGAQYVYQVEIGDADAYDATFISDRDILLYSMSRQAFLVICVEDVSLTSPSSIRTRAYFHWPGLSSGCVYLHASSAPVLGAKGDGVVVAELRVVRTERGSRGLGGWRFDVVIRIPPLLAAVYGQPAGGSPLHIPWSDWGARYARMFDVSICDNMWQSISGYRVARSVLLYDGDGTEHTRTCVLVYDFNPRTVTRAIVTGNVDPVSMLRTGESDEREFEGRHVSQDNLSFGWDEDRAADSLLRRRNMRSDVSVPPTGCCTTRVVTTAFTRNPANSPFDEALSCNMPYRVTARTYGERFIVSQLVEDSLIGTMMWNDEDGERTVVSRVFTM
ncbi:hypothetical protein PENSPDRAFT_667712 [Peniophora sp. CONT]|nr:hypothetical protein PENSPDRAFT_667712 [Peniophora sp. CONT]